MPILGFNFDKLLVEKKKEIKPPLKINTNVNIKDIKKEDTNIGTKGESVLRFDIDFALIYQPKVAEMSLSGHLLYVDKNKVVEKILTDWKKKKQMPPGIMKNILNMALMRFNIKALILAQEVNLPPHLQMPLISGQPPKAKAKKAKKSKAEKYIG